MKKQILIISALLPIILFAQENKWEWAIHINALTIQENHTIMDNRGNCYITGYFSGNAMFDNITISSSGETDVFICKLNPHGKCEWALRAGGKDRDYGEGISIDKTGNVFITGKFNQSAKFGSTKLQSKGASMFIAKINPKGKWEWAKKAGGNTSSKGISTDFKGDTYISGVFSGTAKFAPFSYTSKSANQWDIFVAKINTQGKWQWVTTAEATDLASVKQIAVDNSGNNYVFGDFRGGIYFGDHSLFSNGGSNKRNLFVAKIDKNGKYIWAKNAGGIKSNLTAKAIEVDRRGDLCLTGDFTSTANFNTIFIKSNGQKNVFVAKMANSGKWIWVKAAGGNLNAWAGDLMVDNSNNIYITGGFKGKSATFGSNLVSCNDKGDIFVAKIDMNGNWLGAIKAGGNYFDEGSGICTNPDNTIYSTGTIWNTANLGVHKIKTTYEACMYVAKMQAADFELASANNNIGEDVFKSLQKPVDWNDFYSAGPTDNKKDLKTTALEIRQLGLDKGLDIVHFIPGNIGRHGGLSSGEIAIEADKKYTVWLLVEEEYENTNPFIKLIGNGGAEKIPGKDQREDIRVEGSNVLGCGLMLRESETAKIEIIGLTLLEFDVPGYLIIAKEK